MKQKNSSNTQLRSSKPARKQYIKPLIVLGLLMLTLAGYAQKPIVYDLWQRKPPHNNGDAKDTARVWIYLPDKKVATGRAVVICPGGGYSHLAMDHEGHQWASFFCQEGVATIVLKYRMPHGDPRIPIEDAEQAMKLVRHNAKNWRINANDVGIMGFSAGGHLASTIATHADKASKPDFQILFYPVITMMQDLTHKGSRQNFLGDHPSKKEEREYSNDMQVSRMTPHAFIALSDDDNAVLPANGVNYYVEMFRHDVPATLHVYPSGGHGWGIRSSFKYHLEMLLELRAWLHSF